MELKKLVFGDKVLTVFYFEFASIDFRFLVIKHIFWVWKHSRVMLEVRFQKFSISSLWVSV